MIGEGMTKYLVMTGRSLDAQRAYDIGLVEELAEGDDAFAAAVADLTACLASQPTFIHGLTKRQIHAVRPPTVDLGLQ